MSVEQAAIAILVNFAVGGLVGYFAAMIGNDRRAKKLTAERDAALRALSRWREETPHCRGGQTSECVPMAGETMLVENERRVTRCENEARKEAGNG